MTALTGIDNQIRREMARWGSGGRWRRRLLLWVLILVGLLGVMLWVLPGAMAEQDAALQLDIPATAGQFVELAAVVVVIGATISTQGVLLDDRRSGVMEWVLSKPLSRSALVIAKYIGQLAGTLVAAILVPWLGVWAVLSIAGAGPWPFGPTVGAMGAVALLTSFQIALVIALSVFTWSRAVVLGLPLAMLVGSDLITTFLPAIAPVNPYLLGRAGAALIQGSGLGTPGPALVATGLTVILITAAGIRLEKHEF